MIDRYKKNYRHRIHEILESGAHDDLASKVCDGLIIVLILLNVLAFVLGSVASISLRYGFWLDQFELFSVIFFTLEYALRIWASVEHPPLRALPHWKARMKFALEPFQIIDLLAILPFYLGSLVGLDLRLLRVFRLLRFFKIIRYSPALQVFVRVFYKEGRALIAALLVMVALLLFAATGMHYIEGAVQPDVFGDIPSSMWWALATLTTVGYGDAVPVTALGKIWSGLFMIFGLGMFALPIGIIATGFAQEINRQEFVINWNMVARVPLFNSLEAAEVADIMRLLHSQRFPQGVVIYKKGARATGMYFIVSGEVSLADGEELSTLSAGDFFGETGLLTGGVYQRTARAQTVCHLLELERDDFEYLLSNNKGLNEHIQKLALSKQGNERED